MDGILEHLIQQLFTQILSKSITDEDEVVVQLDSDRVTDDVRKVCSLYQEKIPFMKVVEFPLNNDFASFKNNLINHCSKEWVFNIDADEIPANNLFTVLKDVLRENSSVEMFWVVATLTAGLLTKLTRVVSVSILVST